MHKHEIRKIAHLARIKISDSELHRYSEINTILKFCDQINEVDTSLIEPLTHPLDMTQRLREDRITEINDREVLQSLSPGAIEAGLYLVPNVFEKE